MDGNTEAPAKLPTLLEQIENAKSIDEFDAVEAGLVELETRFKGVVYSDIQTKDGLAKAKADRIEIREVRYRVSAKAKGMKDPLNRLKKLIDGQAERIEARVLAVETPVDEQIKAEETRLEEIKEAKRRAEAERVESLAVKVRGIEAFGHPTPGRTAEQLAADIEAVNAIEITLDAFAERLGDAMVAKNTAIKLLTAAHAAAVAAEAQAAELEAFRKEKAEREAREAAEAAGRAAKEAAERRDREVAEQKVRQEAAEADAKQRVIEQARLDAERAELARKRAELDELLAAARAKQAAPAPVLSDKAEADANALAFADRIVDAEFTPPATNADPGDEAAPVIIPLLTEAAPHSRDAVIDLVASSWFMTAGDAEALLVDLFGGAQ